MASHGVSRVAVPTMRSEEARIRELQQISEYRELVDLVNTKVVERQYTLEVLGFITRLLNENPEYYTIWNHRRLVMRNILSSSSTDESTSRPAADLINQDLHLTFTLLRKFPKCYWIWNHRNWILQQGEANLEASKVHQIWHNELQLVGKMLHADSRNFHAWSYRRFVCQQLDRLLATTTGNVIAHVDLNKSRAELEFEYTTKMIKTNLSNFSAWHHRSMLIPRLLDERGADSQGRRKLLDDELSLICAAVNTDPFDQSIWYYQRYLMSTLTPECPRESSIVLDLTNYDRQKYYANELTYIREILEDESDCKWVYETLLYLARRYLEVDAGTAIFTTRDMQIWLEELHRVDPLRKGRWIELGHALGI